MSRPDAEGAEITRLTEQVRSAEPLLDTASVAARVLSSTARRGGLGVLSPLLADPAVTEVMVNGPGPVWVDRGGAPTRVGEITAAELVLVIERIVDPLGLRVDRSRPFVDARLADGSRVNIVVPPLAVDGPVVTIRRFAATTIPLARFGPAAEPVGDAVAAGSTVLVVGGTGAGKTTLLGSLCSRLAPTERIVTIEDTAELRLPGEHVVRLEARPANSEGVGEVDLRTLVRNALRMRPDRLVVGEVRGPEALDLILALGSGHRGSMATCHASSGRGGLRRLETLALLGGADLAPSAVHSQLLDAVDLVVTVARRGATRTITEVVRVAGAEGDRRVEPVWSSG
ncbi:MAG: CpaF family protein [Acidimicrobiales bacterium]